jgi:signal transduction histidine kinase
MEIVEEEIERDVNQRGLTLSVKRETLPDSPTYGDPERLLQVLMKVIANAIKYTPDGGAITISARELPGFTDLMVEDTGIGIAAEDLSIIFQKFSSMEDVSTHSSGKTKFKGAGPGLGLAIARGIIEAHGGSIWAESEGHSETALPGSTFHILIPMRDAPPEDEMGAEVFRTVTQGQSEWA